MELMVMRVERRGDELCVVLTAEAVETLELREGTAVEVRAVEGEHRYATVSEAMEAFIATEPEHRNSYRELAK